MGYVEAFTRPAVHGSRNIGQGVQCCAHLFNILIQALCESRYLVIPFWNQSDSKVALADIGYALGDSGNGIYRLANNIIYQERKQYKQDNGAGKGYKHYLKYAVA